MKTWQTKCEYKKEISKNTYQNKVCGMNMYAKQHLLCIKTVPKIDRYF